MVNLVLEDLFLGNPKIAPKEYPLPVAKITSHFKKVNEEQSSEKEVYSGSISLNEEAIVKLGYVPNGKETTSRLTVSSAKTAAFIYESSSLSIGKEGMKKLTDSRVLRISRTALEKIYSKHSLDVNDSWVFELVEGCIDLAGVKDLKVLVFKPLEKVA